MYQKVKYKYIQTPFVLFYRVNGEVDDTIETIATGVVTAVVVPIQLFNNGNESALGPTITFFLPQGTRFIRAFDIDSVSLLYILVMSVFAKIKLLRKETFIEAICACWPQAGMCLVS